LLTFGTVAVTVTGISGGTIDFLVNFGLELVPDLMSNPGFTVIRVFLGEEDGDLEGDLVPGLFVAAPVPFRFFFRRSTEL
jgi:hypothetical protein